MKEFVNINRLTIINNVKPDYAVFVSSNKVGIIIIKNLKPLESNNKCFFIKTTLQKMLGIITTVKKHTFTA